MAFWENEKIVNENTVMLNFEFKFFKIVKNLNSNFYKALKIRTQFKKTL